MSKQWQDPNCSNWHRQARDVWRKHFGEIPEGFHVHHKDGNAQNNVIENLQCLSPEEHRKLHPMSEETYWKLVEHIDRIQPLTKTWHRSDEGRAWHVEHGKRTWEDRLTYPRECSKCGVEFESPFDRERDKYCSNKCKSAGRRASGVDNIEKICPACGKRFETNKYRGSKTCSRFCGQRLRRKNEG